MRSTVDASTYCRISAAVIRLVLEKKKLPTRFVIWSQLNSIPISVLESLVTTKTFSTRLSERVVSFILSAT